MKNVLRIEEALMFLTCLYFFPLFNLSWWWLVALILTPDIGMIGYAFGPKAGAVSYNLLHHRGIACVVFIIGYSIASEFTQLAGYIIFAHACLDRMLGYGLKTFQGFGYTHLGAVGK